MSDVEKLARAVIESRVSGMKPKDLIEAVRAKHPKASKKEISRAAFYAVIMMADTHPDDAAEVQALALASRGDDHTDHPPMAKRSGRKSGRGSQAGSAANRRASPRCCC